ncbi:hypothetical protein OAI84_00165 [bacterium]|nr:hypothetical protein [bacterium]
MAFNNLIHYAFYINNGYKLLIPKHNLFLFNTTNLNKNVCNCDKIINLTKKINPCSGHLITLDEMKNLSLKYAKLNLCIPDNSTYDICIHIRDGDIFSHLVHFEYVQPSLDYYKQVLINNLNKSICILYVNGNSPIIPKLKEFIKDNNLKNVTFQHSTVKEDLKILCSCKTLVWSFSSFCFIPYFFSKCLKNNIMPESIFYRTRGKLWVKPFDIIPTNITIIKHPDYILTGYWKNTKKQINKMLTYKLPKIEIEKLKNISN